MAKRNFALLVFLFLLSSISFGLSLRECIDIALENNFDFLAQKQKIKESESQVRQSLGSFFPKLHIEGEFGRNYHSPISYTIAPGTDFALYPDEAALVTGYQITLSQNLFSGGKLSGQLEIDKLRLAIEEENLIKMESELINKVITFYFNVLLAEGMLELNSEAVELSRAHFSRAKNYYSLGLISDADLLRAEAKVAEAEFDRIQAESELESAKIRLNTVIGRDIGTEIKIYPGKMNDNITDESLPVFQELLSEALVNKPELKMQGFKKALAERGIALAKAEFLPDLLLISSASKSITDYQANSLKREENEWNVYGMLSWNLFTGFKTQNKIMENQAILKASEIFEGKTKNQIAAYLKEALLKIYSSKSRIEKAKKEVELANENQKLAAAKYQEGVGGNIELLDTITKLTKSKKDLLMVQIEYKQAKADVNFAVGKEMWELY